MADILRECIEFFDSSFTKEQYSRFSAELFKEYDGNKAWPRPRTGNYIPEKFRHHVASFDRVGRYTDTSHKIIDILIVCLKENSSIFSARTAQRNFIAEYLKGQHGSNTRKDAALVAFVSPKKEDWRLSLVTLKVDIHIKKDKAGLKDTFSPAHRKSFLLGANEKNHTAKKRFTEALVQIQKPTLKSLEELFNVESVSKDFFIHYKALFITLTQALNKQVEADRTIQKEFEEKDINTVDFSKKLLGQIVFIYFLQKKGWLGVEKDASWGEGKKNFLRHMFTTLKKNDNFFRDVLQPLFYEALRIDRSDQGHFYDTFECKIPFLNGGLFDPLHHYHWKQSTLTLPNEIFSNEHTTKAGDTGDGILDIFDRFNFTIKEDEPLETEVAIDPELLGRIYEQFNAIRTDNFDMFIESKKRGKETEFNKEYGVFYTPRPIVHYMCQQSLIEYLFTQLQNIVQNQTIPKKDIENFVLHAINIIEHEKNTEKKDQETNTYSYKIPNTIRTNAKIIDKLLKTICICDPAIGSGAFPVGMMNEIITLRTLLQVYISNKDPNIYDYKRHCIEHTLYGVDIDAGATEIARLRLWLSLVVDEDGNNGIHPLPNLDYKIIAGNSLKKCNITGLFVEDIKKLETLQDTYTTETNPQQKQILIQQIEQEKKEFYKQQKLSHPDSFDITIELPAIFGKEKKGFDIIIQNPPYRQLQKMKKEEKEQYKSVGYTSFASTGDIYCLFYERAIELLKEHGHLCTITSNKWLRASYGEKLRTFLCQYHPKILLDLGSNVFETATVDTNILLIQKLKVSPYTLQACSIATIKPEIKDISDILPEHFVTLDTVTKDAWIILNQTEQNIKNKIETLGTRLKDFDSSWNININRGVVTGYNKAFIIDTTTKERLVKEDPKSAEIIKPVLRGKDIRRYKTEWAGLWMLFIPWHFPLHKDSTIEGNSEQAEKAFKKEYSTVYQYLKQHKEKLSSRNKAETNIRYEWYTLQRCAATYHQEFEKEKIIYSEIVQGASFDLDIKKRYPEATTFFITGNGLRYLLALLNSTLLEYAFKQFYAGGGLGDEGVRYKKIFFLSLPIPSLSQQEQAPFKTLVNTILHKREQNQDITQEEKAINTLVYKLYGLTPKEIAVVEANVRQ